MSACRNRPFGRQLRQSAERMKIFIKFMLQGLLESLYNGIIGIGS